jgi:ribonuclease HIII
MNYLIGTDEAGYGPPLGPLVVAATVWELPDDGCEAVDVDLYGLLKRYVCRRVRRTTTGPARRVQIADSKALYNPAQGIGQLEQGVLVALAQLDAAPATWHEMWDAVSLCGDDVGNAAPWHEDYEARLPLAAEPDQILRLARRLRGGCERTGVRLRAIGGRAVFPEQFNELLEEYGNKSDALSAISMELLSEMMAPLAGGRVSVICDKHGGRDYYAPLVQHYFPEWFIEVRGEGPLESRYQFGPSGKRTTICFRCRGERHLPVALASMTAKYLRELAMRAFNDYWRRHLPNLHPTAGYSHDARRFRKQIAETQLALGIDDRILWRDK